MRWDYRLACRVGDLEPAVNLSQIQAELHLAAVTASAATLLLRVPSFFYHFYWEGDRLFVIAGRIFFPGPTFAYIDFAPPPVWYLKKQKSRLGWLPPENVIYCSRYVVKG